MNSAEIWDELGSTCFKAEALDKAVEAFVKAIEQKSQSGWTYANLASIYVQQGRYSEAIQLYQQSLELFDGPKDQAIIWGRLGNIHHQLNEHGKAIQAYQKADEILPKRLAGRTKSIFPIQKASRVQKSGYSSNQSALSDVEIESSSPAREPDASAKDTRDIEDNANVWNELGLILFKVGAYDDAIESYQKAINLQPDYGWLYSNLGQVYATQGKLSQAVELYEISIKLLLTSKEKAVSWTRLGDIFRQMDKYDEAMAAYQLADALNQTVTPIANEFRQVDPRLIIANVGQSRSSDDIEDLVASMRAHGIIQPLIVCPRKNDNEKYTLIAGRRRLEAALRLDMRTVPVIVRQANDQEILELSLSENIHSSAINPFDLAKSYRQMANDFDLSIEEISERIGRSPHSVANAMKVLESTGENYSSQPLKYALGDQARPVVSTDQELETMTGPGELPNAAHTSQPGTTSGSFTTPVSDQAHSSRSDAAGAWYLDHENEAIAAPPEDESLANDSLLVRARHALKCNPHTRRAWTVPSFRA